MTAHVMKSDMARLRARTLTPAATLAVVRHIESCSECAALAESAVDLQAAKESWSSSLQPGLGDHLRGDELSDYADSRLTPAAMRDAGAHLEACAVCRSDVADLRRLSRRRLSWQSVALSAAAVLIVIISLGILLRRAPATAPPGTTSRPPAPVSPTPAPLNPSLAAWQRLVDDAVANGRIAPPAILATLRMPGDVARGDEPLQDSVCTPKGVVIDKPRPAFRWSGSEGAVYTVSVLDGDREVARSAPLRSGVWRPDRDLSRGRTYRWQVGASRGKKTWIIPAAPLPAPVFALLDDADHRDLESARSAHPDDHLLLGVLAAHYGLQAEAVEELTRHHLAHPDAGSAALLDSVRAWQKGDGR